MSASLPKGTKNIAADKRYAVATQPKSTASMANSLPMVGRAIFTEEPIKGVRKAVSVATSKAVLLVAESLVLIGTSTDFID
jgi:hypothetical protein